MNRAAAVVVWVVAAVVLGYMSVDVVNCYRAGKMDEASRQLFSAALTALIAIIATTGKGNPPNEPQQVNVVNTPANPVPTDPQADTATVTER